MSWIGWIVIGFLAGAIAGWATKTPREGCITTTVIGIVGALIGGGLLSWAGWDGPGSFLTALLGAVLLLLVLKALGRLGSR
jgi:uncharacterized membrane protein YeaQ/YmgE (transglycosylase-associated protein family)